MSGKVRYIKIARIDGDGNDITNTLENLTEITIPLSAGNRTYPVVNRTRQNDFYLYYINPPGTNDIPLADHSNLNFDFSSSMNGSFSARTPVIVDFNNILYDSQSFATTETINTGVGTTTGEVYKFQNTYPSVGTKIVAGGSITATNELSSNWTIALNRNAETIDQLNWQPSIDGATQSYNFEFSSSAEVAPNDSFFLRVNIDSSATPISFTTSLSSQFQITTATNSSVDISLILEPYLSQLFFNQGCDVLINNVSQGIPNPFVNDLDYSTTTTVPINFDAVVSGSATKSTIPQSHYTQLSSIIPRYLGAKSTSQRINIWTPPTVVQYPSASITLVDEGNFGKLPNVNSLNNVILFCEWIGGNAPERMDAVTAKIKYLIYQDGTVEKPNLNELALYNLQNAFRNGENLEVTLTADDSTLQNSLSGLRKIIRGGARIENILTTQTGSVTSTPENNFPNDIIITNSDPLYLLDNNSINKYNFNYTSGSNALLGNAGDSYSGGNTITFPNKIFNFADDLNVNIGNANSLWQGYYYTQTNDSKTKNIETTLIYNFTLENTNPEKNRRKNRRIHVDFGQAGNFANSKGLIYDEITGDGLYSTINYIKHTKTHGDINSAVATVGPGFEKFLKQPGKLQSLNDRRLVLWAKGRADEWGNPYRAKSNIEISVTIKPTQNYQPVLNLSYFQEGNAGGVDAFKENGFLEIKGGASVRSYQSPPPDVVISPAVNINSQNNIWSLTGSYTTDANGDSTFTLTSSADFYGIYGGTNIQETVDDWGFDTITSPIEFFPADEFRFMGEELNTFIVESVSTGSTGTVEVTFTKNLPISSSYQVAGSDATMQWDWFNVRRYTDNSDYVIFEAVKPAGASGTAIIKPQYVVNELDKGVNEIIVDLTERGLIS